MRTIRSLAYAALVMASVLLIFVAGYGTRWFFDRRADAAADAAGAADAAPETQENTLGVFWEAWRILQSDFYGDQPDTQKRTYGAIKGLAQAYDDPYTFFVEPEPRQREKENLSGEFGGIGAYVRKDEQSAFRLDPMPDRPAEKAGILKDDVLLAVDGTQLTSEMTSEDVVELIRGPVGEAVALQIRRDGAAEPITIEVVRERIETPSVEWRLLENAPQMGYVAIRQFTERTAGELDRAIGELNQQGAQQVVIDLRHNSGGLLQSSIEVASRFLADGVVVYERKSDGSEQSYQVVSAPRAPNWPVAILVDEATASASEIVAGALQDRGRATLLGDKTFGKGSVQLVYDLSDGSSVHVTVARWLTPNGHEINGIGLTPDYLVPHEDHRDAPLEEAIRILRDDPANTQ
jgi:carboxyl-terminal processing protease